MEIEGLRNYEGDNVLFELGDFLPRIRVVFFLFDKFSFFFMSVTFATRSLVLNRGLGRDVISLLYGSSVYDITDFRNYFYNKMIVNTI